MIRRCLMPIAAALLVFPMAGCTAPPAEDDTKPATPGSSAPPTPSGVAGGPAQGGLSLAAAVARIQNGAEKRDGYERDSFKHWVDDDGDGCHTRAEVLITEATTKPGQGERCALSGGVWRSYYDNIEVTDARTLDIDHMVPLAEAWDSGAHDWTPERRQAYANDLGAEPSLVAVTAKSNRSKSDKDPAQWLPPAGAAHCRYAADWTATKLRWKLTADEKERAALLKLANTCPDTAVEYETAP
ncbi:HNH endonuclease family protein [Streptomyces sp. CAU 1734]|uniref:HNH endonuclease family protein n=1 Tax=Streptomyces sp. CAU 1734 TaxID=3140360 RepID=UPI003260432D